MGTVESLVGKTTYVDANILIYAIEGYEPQREFVEALFKHLEQRRFTGITSEFTLAELLVKPFELQRDDLVSAYRELFQSSGRLTIVPVDHAILVEAARQRAAYRLTLPDAIHVATALAAGCDMFLTNDLRLKLPPGLPRHLI
jgi:predicted nucleic acid-binding protein